MLWLGVILSLIGGLWIVVNAFRASVLWGLGSLFVPFVSLVFAIMNFRENKIPLLISVAGGVLVAMGWSSYIEAAALQGAVDAAQ